jgi:hypothetical protein
MITEFLTKIFNDASKLQVKYPDVVNELRSGSGQGTGNVPTFQEAAFSVELKKSGFKALQSQDIPIENGCYYKYQPNGTQRSIDFLLIEKKDETTLTVPVDLKQTNSKTFYWNDGWFEDDVLYVISFVDKKNPRVYIGYGKNSYTQDENVAILKRREIIKQLNSCEQCIGSLRLYSRQANQYKCDRFTSEFCEEKFSGVLRNLTYPEEQVQQVLPEPHSQSA